jgi:hypothetical protein
MAGPEERIFRWHSGEADGVDEGAAHGVVDGAGRQIQAVAGLEIDHGVKGDDQPHGRDRGEGQQVTRESVAAAAQDGEEIDGGRRIDQPDQAHGAEAARQVGDDRAECNRKRDRERDAEGGSAAAEGEKIERPGRGVSGDG